MKRKSWLFLSMIAMLTFQSCKLGHGNFNRQKYTTLKHQEPSRSIKTTPENDLESEPATLIVQDSEYTEEIIRTEEQSVMNPVSSTPLATEEETTEENLNKLKDEEILTPRKQVRQLENRKNMILAPNKAHQAEPEEWKIKRKVGHITLAAALTLLLGSLVTVILLGGINGALTLAIVAGIVLLIVSFVFYTKAGDLRKKSPWAPDRNKGLLRLGVAAVLIGLGLILTIVFWTELLLIIALAVALLFLIAAIVSFVKAFKIRLRSKKA